MTSSDLAYLFTLGLNLFVILEGLQVALYGYGFIFRLLKHDRRQPWIPALMGMSLTGATIAATYFIFVVYQTAGHIVDSATRIALSLLLLLGFRLKTVTIWRIDYGFRPRTRIGLFLAEFCFVLLLTLTVHYHYGL